MSRQSLNRQQSQPPIQQQCYTRQEPDGTIVTTTVQTKYVEPRSVRTTRYVDETTTELGCGPGILNTRYCLEPPGILRIAEIVIALIIISLITSVFGPGPFKGVLFGQTFIMLFTGIALCLTFIFLLVYFFRLHRTHLNFWPWFESDLFFSVLAAIVFMIASFLEAYYSTGAWSNNCNDIGGDGIIHNGCRLIYEWAFAAFFCFVLSVLYALSAVFAHHERNKYYREQQHLNSDEQNFSREERDFIK